MSSARSLPIVTTFSPTFVSSTLPVLWLAAAGCATALATERLAQADDRAPPAVTLEMGPR